MRQLFTRAEYEGAVKAIAEKVREGEREIPQPVQRRCRGRYVGTIDVSKCRETSHSDGRRQAVREEELDRSC